MVALADQIMRAFRRLMGVGRKSLMERDRDSVFKSSIGKASTKHRLEVHSIDDYRSCLFFHHQY